MARNRKRPRDRRPARPANASALATAAGLPTDTPPESGSAPDVPENGSTLEPPEPMAHTSPGAELAEAQLAVGRPDADEVPDEAELDAYEEAAPGSGRGAAPALREEHAPERQPAVTTRMVTFIRGSWRELQRVQWPDRRQVMQATGVVIGFVIVAGVFLGVSDVVAQKIVNLILYGHG